MRQYYLIKSMLSFMLMVITSAAWAQGQDDFSTLTATIQYGTRTTTAGWVATNAAVQDNILYAIIPSTTKAVCINGKTSSVGIITSPDITGGIGTLTLNYARVFTETNGVSFKVELKDKTGKTIATQNVVNATLAQTTVASAQLNFDRSDATKIVITNNSPSNKATSNIDRTSIWNISWTAASGVVKTASKTTFQTGTQSSYDIFLGESFTAPTATVDNSGTVTYGSSSTSVATVDPATGAVTLVAPGSTTITASYAGDATYAASSASYTLNVGNVYNNLQELQAGATTTSSLAKITFDNVIVTGIKNTSNAYISDGQYGAMIYTSGHGLTAGKVLNGTIVAKVVLYGGATEITNFTTNGLTITDGILTPTVTKISSITLPNQSNYIQLNNVTYDATAKTLADGTSTIAFYDGLTTGMTLVDGVTYNITGVVGYYNKLQVFPAIAEALPTNVAISAAQYATYVAPFDINISKSDVEAYTVSLLDGAYAVLTPVTLIPKWSVILLKGTEGTHALYSDATQTYTALTDNLLVASTTDVIADGSQYILAMLAGSPVGFYRANSGSTIQAGKGYLSIPLTPTAKFLGFTFDTTGIDKVNASTENNVIYNLNGQKISAPFKGVNIINGKKVVVK